MKKIKTVGLAVLAGLIIIQLIRPERNLSNDTSHDISVLYKVPDTVKAILKTSCNDCHSNLTEYPWYANIQPVGWWLTHHVNEGKEELNFNNFASYRIGRQYFKLEKLAHEVHEGEMPLSSYTLIHRHAALSEGQKKILTDWANAIHDSIKAAYPADSLKRPSRGPRR
jgi:Haem-binding domain